MGYVQGSQSVESIQSQAIRPGRLAPRPPIRTPAPPVHAVPEGGTVALCGTECLHIFPDQPWERGFGGSAEWCHACVELAPRTG